MAEPLRTQMEDSARREALLDGAVTTLEEEVKGAGGISGLAVKGAFKVLSGVRPGFVRHAVDRLLDDFLDALEPHYQEALRTGARPGALVAARADQVADSLLAVTDGKVSRTSQDMVRKTYDKLRPMAKKQVANAAPSLGRLLDQHADKA